MVWSSVSEKWSSQEYLTPCHCSVSEGTLLPCTSQAIVLLNQKFFAEFIKKETRWSLSCKWIYIAAVSFYRSHSGSHTERCSTQHGAFGIMNIMSSQSQLELCRDYFLKRLPKLSCFLETFWLSNSLGILKQEKYLTKKSCLLKALLLSYFKEKIGNTYEGCSYLPVKSVLINKII